jgi:Flp pilus assembly protein TadG
MLKATRRFGRDKKGLAAVEFALILPVMITLFFGIVELSMALAARADVTNMASIAADLTAQESSMTSQDMANVFAASSAILYPYSTSPLTITVYSIIDNNNSTGKVAWSCTKTGSGSATDGPTTPPAGSTGGDIIAATNLDANGNPKYGGSGSVILAVVSYNYASPTTKIVTGPVAMSNTFYSKPRRVAQITKPAACS